MKHNIQKFKDKATELGFQSIGVSKATKLDAEAKRLEDWLNHNYHGEMSYMERYFDLRIDPKQLFPGTKSVIVLSINYYQEEITSETSVKIARYAYGEDYHHVLKAKAKILETWMKEEYGNIQFRAFVDSAPIMERVWAEKSGISWNGKNTLSIHPRQGSFFFLMCVLTDLEFDYTDPIKDYCGTCTRCIDACPTKAIHPNGYLLDASKCISYLTIELKNSIPAEFKDKMENWAFGCDICQEVCPWNRFATKTKEDQFEPKKELFKLSTKDWLEITDQTWNELSKNSPLKRSGKTGMQRNIKFLIDS
ncbi:MAG: tRNA epoxyqueuosine(34) reductase QueG [Saprospiraceae bacterium]